MTQITDQKPGMSPMLLTAEHLVAALKEVCGDIEDAISNAIYDDPELDEHTYEAVHYDDRPRVLFADTYPEDPYSVLVGLSIDGDDYTFRFALTAAVRESGSTQLGGSLR